MSRIDVRGVAVGGAESYGAVPNAANSEIIRRGVEEIGLELEFIELGSERSIFTNSLLDKVGTELCHLDAKPRTAP